MVEKLIKITNFMKFVVEMKFDKMGGRKIDKIYRFHEICG